MMRRKQLQWNKRCWRMTVVVCAVAVCLMPLVSVGQSPSMLPQQSAAEGTGSATLPAESRSDADAGAPSSANGRANQSTPKKPSPWASSALDALRNAVGADASSSSEALPAPGDAGANSSRFRDREHVLPLGTPADDIDIQEDGGLISLAVRDAPLRHVIALVAQTQKLNIVFASPAEVPVTATFERVHWRRVLESLVDISGHVWTLDNDIIYITNMEAADFVAPNAGGRNVQVFELDFASAVDVEATVAGLLSPAGKSWVLETSSDDNRRTRETVAVVDYPANLARISDYICQMDQPPRQVFIEANILQVTLNDTCRSGVNFNQIASFSGNELGIHFLSPGVPNPGQGITEPGESTASLITVDGGSLGGLVEALKSTTDAKTLASPKLLAVSGQESHMQIGEKIGYLGRITTSAGGQQQQQEVQFLDVGVVLTVTPRVTRDGRVLMRVFPKVSTGGVDQSGSIPSEQTTEIQTDILLNDGQGLVIGGLIQEIDSNDQSKIPWIGDLPYVGVLFQTRRIVKERKEIIVTLVPRVLPYNPIYAQEQHHQFMRTQERLTEGPLNRVPRPYEANLPDTFTNPRTPVRSLGARVAMRHELHQPAELQPLPPIDQYPEFVEEHGEAVYPEIRFPSDIAVPAESGNR